MALIYARTIPADITAGAAERRDVNMLQTGLERGLDFRKIDRRRLRVVVTEKDLIGHAAYLLSSPPPIIAQLLQNRNRKDGSQAAAVPLRLGNL